MLFFFEWRCGGVWGKVVCFAGNYLRPSINFCQNRETNVFTYVHTSHTRGKKKKIRNTLLFFTKTVSSYHTIHIPYPSHVYRQPRRIAPKAIKPTCPTRIRHTLHCHATDHACRFLLRYRMGIMGTVCVWGAVWQCAWQRPAASLSKSAQRATKTQVSWISRVVLSCPVLSPGGMHPDQRGCANFLT